MQNHLHDGIEEKKDFYIDKLLDRGIYKTKNQQLYELSLSELEQEYRKISLK